MGEPDDPSLLQSVKSKAKAFGLRRDKDTQPVLPQHVVDGTSATPSTTSNTTLTEKPSHVTYGDASHGRVRNSTHSNVANNKNVSPPPPAPPPDLTAAASKTDPAIEPKPPMSTRMKNGSKRFISHTKDALFHSWINVLLIFVPIGIAVHSAGLGPEIVFAMNAVAIIPLAGLLAHATEAVAARLGDTLGALLNVSFGNAVELILFIILLAGDQIRVVQAALLGSILANLLLILGMAFLLGGLRYQEQVSLLLQLICARSGLMIPGVQLYRHPDECLHAQSGCYEFATSHGFSFRLLKLFDGRQGDLVRQPRNQCHLAGGLCFVPHLPA